MWNVIVAIEDDVVKSRSVTAPSGCLGILHAHNMCGRAHVNAALAQRPIHEADFHLDCRSVFNLARREKKYAARADILRDQRNSVRLRLTVHTNEPKRKIEECSRSASPLV